MVGDYRFHPDHPPKCYQCCYQYLGDNCEPGAQSHGDMGSGSNAGWTITNYPNAWTFYGYADVQNIGSGNAYCGGAYCRVAAMAGGSQKGGTYFNPLGPSNFYIGQPVLTANEAISAYGFCKLAPGSTGTTYAQIEIDFYSLQVNPPSQTSMGSSVGSVLTLRTSGWTEVVLYNIAVPAGANTCQAHINLTGSLNNVWYDNLLLCIDPTIASPTKTGVVLADTANTGHGLSVLRRVQSMYRAQLWRSRRRGLAQVGSGAAGATGPAGSTGPTGAAGSLNAIPYTGLWYDVAALIYETTLSYSLTSPARQLTITPTGATWRVWVNGTLYTFTGAQTISHAATQGLWYIYVDNTGTITASQTFWNILDVAPIALIYYDATTPDYWLFDERHHYDTPVEWHQSQHFAIGTFIKNLATDFVIGGYTLNTDTDTAVQWSMTSGTAVDEDIENLCNAISSGGPYQVMHRSGASGYFPAEPDDLAFYLRPRIVYLLESIHRRVVGSHRHDQFPAGQLLHLRNDWVRWDQVIDADLGAGSSMIFWLRLRL